MALELVFERDGVHLAGVDFGERARRFCCYTGWPATPASGPTAGWLSERGRVVALDARGHGGSERFPADVSPRAHIADAVFAVEQLQLGPSVVIGQSFGGLTAILLAAARPDLVRGLVVADAGPGRRQRGLCSAGRGGHRRIAAAVAAAVRDTGGGHGVLGWTVAAR